MLKKIYDEFFHVPKHNKGNVSEKVLISRISVSIAGIIICLAAMSTTAYAYFAHTSCIDKVQECATTWDIAVATEDDVVLSDGVYCFDNSAGMQERVFNITVSQTQQESTETVGYVRIDIITDFEAYETIQTYYSLPIGEVLEDGTVTTRTEREISVAVPAGEIAYVTFSGEWGTCAKTPVADAIITPQFMSDIGWEQSE